MSKICSRGGRYKHLTFIYNLDSDSVVSPSADHALTALPLHTYYFCCSHLIQEEDPGQIPIVPSIYAN